jgi:hypothetical protein
MIPTPSSRQGGLALPVMMMMMVVMLISTLYLFRASNSSTLTTANLAYESSLSRAVDLGLLNAFDWLKATAAADRTVLAANSTGNGYIATLDTTQTVSSAGFWTGSVSFDDDNGNHIEYIIHRMCKYPGAFDLAGPPANSCVQTVPLASTGGGAVALGTSLASNGVQYAGSPEIHYVITARIFGKRGGNVVNQSVVLIGA